MSCSFFTLKSQRFAIQPVYRKHFNKGNVIDHVMGDYECSCNYYTHDYAPARQCIFSLSAPFAPTFTNASLCVVAGAPSFPLSSPHHEINRPGPLLLSTSNHFTAGHGSSKPQRDMSVKKRDEERKRGGPFKDILSLSLSPFEKVQRKSGLLLYM